MRILLFLISTVLLAQPDPAVRKCIVEGVVVQEISGQPMRHVEIGLVPVRDRKPGQASPAAIGAYSDSNGRFRIPELEPGVYRVRLRKDGFSPTLPSGSIVLPKLEPGQELGDLKFTMAPQSVLAGRVLDDNGDPVANANLMLLRSQVIRGRRTNMFQSGFATTDDRGHFYMAGIDPGRYILCADEMDSRDVVFPSGGGGALTAYVTTYYPGVSDQSQAQLIEVARGTVETGLEIRLRREPVFAVRGRALDANGQPLQRFTVSARTSPAGSSVYLGNLSNSFLDGEFALPGLRAGTWILTAVPNGINTLLSAEIHIGSGPVDGVVLRPFPKQQISGTIILEEAGNIAPDWQRVAVSIVAAEGFFGARPPGFDASGQFTLSFAGTGRARLNIEGVPAPGTYLAKVLLGAQDVTGKDFDVTAEGLPPLRLVFRRDAATLTGRAENADPNALAGWPAISLWPADPEQRDARTAVSGGFQPDGTFTITGIRPGEYLVYVGPAFQARPPAEPPEDLETRSTRVRLEPGSTQAIVVKLPRQGSAR